MGREGWGLAICIIERSSGNGAERLAEMPLIPRLSLRIQIFEDVEPTMNVSLDVIIYFFEIIAL